MHRPFNIVDVFAEKKYEGNQLAVIFDTTGSPTETMQKITNEMNYSETTFITEYNTDKKNHKDKNIQTRRRDKSTVAPVLTVIEVKAKTFPKKTKPVLIVAELPTYQKTLQTRLL